MNGCHFGRERKAMCTREIVEIDAISGGVNEWLLVLLLFWLINGYCIVGVYSDGGGGRFEKEMYDEVGLMYTRRHG